jgi:phosphoadenosine phosphosulfate reductase
MKCPPGFSPTALWGGFSFPCCVRFARGIKATSLGEPLNRFLSTLDAWVTGLRRDQTSAREKTPKIEIDRAHAGIAKLNPIADWSREQVADYVRENEVPTNRLHAEGYPSVGCDPCSRAIGPDDDLRSGRWWWENSELKECGIHLEEKGSGI